VNKADFASANMKAGKMNCAQSVINAFCEDLGLDRILALKLALGFGGGMGHTGQTCGAVSAAYMVLNLKQNLNPEDPKRNKDKVYALIAEFTQKFIQQNGSTLCTNLLGYDLRDPQQAAAAKEKGVFANICPKLVHDAVDIAEKL
jgi:C_GCAxxG_C_C family probable redox protein